MINHEEHIIFVINLNLKLAYMHLKGTLTVPNTGTVAAPDNRNKKGRFKNCAPFANSLCEINNTQVNDAHDTDI